MHEQKTEILVFIGWLYLIQGIPYGIQDKFIPVELRLQNLTFTNVSLMKGLLLPWICKGVWAPFIQVYFGPYFWLLFSVTGLSVVSVFGGFISPGNIYGIAIVLLLMNLLSAIQDIVVDGFALNSLQEMQLGFGNSLQVVLYKVGSLLGGAGLIYISNYTSWSASYVFLSVLYLLSVVALVIRKDVLKSTWNTNLVHEKEKEILSERKQRGLRQEHISTKLKLESREERDCLEKNATECRGLKKVFAILKEVLETKSMIRLSTYIAVYKMGERAAANNFPLYLLDKGVSSNQLAFWNGIISQTLSILGSIVGGLKLFSNERKGTNRLLKTYIIHRSLAIFMFYLIIQSWHGELIGSKHETIFFYLSMFSLMYLSFTSGVISTATFTLMMEESRKLSKLSQATHYSCLASIEVGGKLIFATLSGLLIELFNISRSFLLFFSLSLLPFFLL